jgi:hypothetical protein
MSEVKRYSFWPQIVHLPGGGGVRAEVHFKVEEDGLFVAHQDYARLKAEVERLKMEESKLLTLCETYEAELERLRKAGDAVALDYAERIEIEAGDTAKNLMKKLPVLREWNATKEGKQP